MVVSTVPGKWDVALNDVGFMLDDSSDEPALQRQSIRTQKEQSVQQGNTGEATVNPEGFWRRSIDGWHHGAGQTYYDREESDPLRFRTSQGVNVFDTKHQLTLLNAVSLGYTASTSGVFVLVAGARLYLRDGDTVKFTADPLTLPWTTTTVTGTSTQGSTPRGITTDGSTLYIAYGANGIYTTTATTSTATSFITGDVNSVAYVKGRLIAWRGTSIYNPTAGGALPAALLTLPTNMAWQQVAEGPNHIYMLAASTSRTLIYKTTIKADGTALDVPTVAGELPHGEVGTGLYGYMGKVFIGTKAGVRMAAVDADGNLIIGSRIPITRSEGSHDTYTAFEADDRFVWYSDVGTSDAGFGTAMLSRMDLTAEILPNTPAYAPDLREPTGVSQSDITSIVTWSGKRIYAYSTRVYVETSTPVASGTLHSGLIALDLADAKAPVAFDVEAATPSTSSIAEALSYDKGSTFTTVGTRSTAGGDAEFAITGQAAVRQFEIRTTLTAAGASSPTLYRHTLKVEPAVSQGNYIIARLRVEGSTVDQGNGIQRRNPFTLRAAVEALQASRAAVTFQEGGNNYTVTVRDIAWEARTRSPDFKPQWDGVMVCRMKVVA